MNVDVTELDTSRTDSLFQDMLRRTGGKLTNLRRDEKLILEKAPEEVMSTGDPQRENFKTAEVNRGKGENVYVLDLTHEIEGGEHRIIEFTWDDGRITFQQATLKKPEAYDDKIENILPEDLIKTVNKWLSCWLNY